MTKALRRPLSQYALSHGRKDGVGVKSWLRCMSVVQPCQDMKQAKHGRYPYHHS